VVPDDVLHLVPFDACPLAEGSVGGEPVLAGDRFRVEVRATLRELLNPPPAPSSSHTLVALGGASFHHPPEGLDVGQLREQSEPAPAPDAGSRGGLARFERACEPLPFSAEEAHALAALHAEAFEGAATAVVLDKRRASRAAFESLAPGARWLHVATHGWTMPATTLSWGDGPPAGEDEFHAPRLDGAETLRGLSPMLLCGLALAGANLPADAAGRAPGLLTAEELAAVDPSGCELVVLSACETARGDVRRAGQGVASLQKAVQIASARSVVTSLWKVPDQAMKELMLDFYRRVWVERLPKAQALWEAKCRLRQAVDASGARRYGLRDSGAWVLSGEPD
jgi:CHAT domain-containing protein